MTIYLKSPSLSAWSATVVSVVFVYFEICNRKNEKSNNYCIFKGEKMNVSIGILIGFGVLAGLFAAPQPSPENGTVEWLLFWARRLAILATIMGVGFLLAAAIMARA